MWALDQRTIRFGTNLITKAKLNMGLLIPIESRTQRCIKLTWNSTNWYGFRRRGTRLIDQKLRTWNWTGVKLMYYRDMGGLKDWNEHNNYLRWWPERRARLEVAGVKLRSIEKGNWKRSGEWFKFVERLELYKIEELLFSVLITVGRFRIWLPKFTKNPRLKRVFDS